MANQKNKQVKNSTKAGLEKKVPKALTGSMVNFGTLGIVILFFVSLYLISPPLKFPWSTLKAGDYPKESILAEVDFTVKDLEATRLAGEQEAREAPPVYTIDPEIVGTSLADADTQFEKIGQDVLNPLFTREERIVLLSKYMPGSISEETLRFLVDLDEEQLESLQTASVEILKHLLNQGILGDVPGSAKQIVVFDRANGLLGVVPVQFCHIAEAQLKNKLLQLERYDDWDAVLVG